MYSLSSVVYENEFAWVFEDKKKGCYTVFRRGTTHSESDSSYALNEDGLSIAMARAKYLHKRHTPQNRTLLAKAMESSPSIEK